MAENKEKIIIDFQTNADQAKNSTDGLNASLKVTDTTAEHLAKTFEEVYGELKPLTTRMGEAEDRLYELALAGDTASKEYSSLLKVVGEYRKTQIATDLAVDAAATTLGQKLAGAANVAATGVSAVTSGMALFGDQSEETQKALLKVQAAMAFADSISKLSDLRGQFTLYKNIVIETYSKIVAAKQAETIATTEATAAQNRLNLSVLKNPYVIAAAALVAITIATVAWYQANSEATKREDALKKSIESNTKATDSLKASSDSLKSTQSALNEIQLLQAKAHGATTSEIRSLIKAQSDLEESNAKLNKNQAYSNYAKLEQEYYNALKTNNDDLIARSKENLASAFSYLKETQEAEKKARYDTQKTILTNQIEVNSEMKAEADKQEAEAQKRRDKEKEGVKKSNDDFAKEADEREKYYLELKKSNREQEIDTVKEIKAKDKERANADLKEQEDGLKVKNEMEAYYANEVKARDKAVADAKIVTNAELINSGENFARAAQVLAGKNKGIQKAAIITEGTVAVGKAAVNTAEAVTKDLAKGFPLSIPLVAADVAVGAASIVSIISNTKKALQAVGGGSISAPSNVQALGASATPQTGFQASSENQIATSITASQQDTQPIKAYVVGSDVTTQQTLDAKLVKENSIGD